MPTQGSYEISSFAVNPTAELQRLNAQVDLFWDQECALYERVGLGLAATALDCGCGQGYLLQKLHAAYPAVEWTGIDVDPELVRAAQERLAGNSHEEAIHQQSITAMEFPDGSFDFAIARLVLEHVPDPLEALGEIRRVLKPGGKVLVIDNDFDFHERISPHSPALEEVYDAYRRARRADGGHPCIGRQLPCLLSQAGFDGVGFQIIAAHSQLAGIDPFLKAEGSGIPAQLVKAGFLSPEALDQVIAEWRTMITHPDRVVFRMLFAAWGVKPLTDHCGREEPEKSRGLSFGPAVSAAGNSLEEIREFMRQALAAEMNFPANSLRFDESLIQQGVDSLAALGLCNQIQSRLSVAIAASDILSGKSIDELTAQVLQQIETRAPKETSAIPAQPRYDSSGNGFE